MALAYEDIGELWTTAETPELPNIQAVELNAATTALLILDIEERTCNAERRPRCLETVPRIAALAGKARKAGAPVVYSLTSQGTPDTILPPVQPQAGELYVQSSVDKFHGTNLEQILRDKGVETVIVTGTAAHGAVLFTATAAARRGFQVVVPVDCLSAARLYTEQAATWVLFDGPGARRVTRLTRSEDIALK